MRSEKALTGTTSSLSRLRRAKPSSISRSRPGLAGSPSKSNISGCSPSAAMTRRLPRAWISGRSTAERRRGRATSSEGESSVRRGVSAHGASFRTRRGHGTAVGRRRRRRPGRPRERSRPSQGCRARGLPRSRLSAYRPTAAPRGRPGAAGSRARPPPSATGLGRGLLQRLDLLGERAGELVGRVAHRADLVLGRERLHPASRPRAISVSMACCFFSSSCSACWRAASARSISRWASSVSASRPLSSTASSRSCWARTSASSFASSAARSSSRLELALLQLDALARELDLPLDAGRVLGLAVGPEAGGLGAQLGLLGLGLELDLLVASSSSSCWCSCRRCSSMARRWSSSARRAGSLVPGAARDRRLAGPGPAAACGVGSGAATGSRGRRRAGRRAARGARGPDGARAAGGGSDGRERAATGAGAGRRRRARRPRRRPGRRRRPVDAAGAWRLGASRPARGRRAAGSSFVALDCACVGKTARPRTAAAARARRRGAASCGTGRVIRISFESGFEVFDRAGAGGDGREPGRRRRTSGS